MGQHPNINIRDTDSIGTSSSTTTTTTTTNSNSTIVISYKGICVSMFIFRCLNRVGLVSLPNINIETQIPFELH